MSTTTLHPFENTPAGRIDHTATVAESGLFKSAVASSAYRHDHTAGAIYYLARTWTFTLAVTWSEWRALEDAGLYTCVNDRLDGAFDMGKAEWRADLNRGGGDVSLVVHRRINFVSRAKLPKGAEKVSAAIDKATALGALKVRSPADLVRVLASVIVDAVTECRAKVQAERDVEQVKTLRRQIAVGLRADALKAVDYDRRLRELNEELLANMEAREPEFRAAVLGDYLGDGRPDGASKALPEGVEKRNLRAACATPVDVAKHAGAQYLPGGVSFDL